MFISCRIKVSLAACVAFITNSRRLTKCYERSSTPNSFLQPYRPAFVIGLTDHVQNFWMLCLPSISISKQAQSLQYHLPELTIYKSPAAVTPPDIFNGVLFFPFSDRSFDVLTTKNSETFYSTAHSPIRCCANVWICAPSACSSFALRSLTILLFCHSVDLLSPFVCYILQIWQATSQRQTLEYLLSSIHMFTFYYHSLLRIVQ